MTLRETQSERGGVPHYHAPLGSRLRGHDESYWEEKFVKRSDERILTTHVGALPRPQELGALVQA
ncbi:MAG: hypothetical protein OXT51_10450, partial [Chloroflexota bacterium]|nr:hypothetical protein [Chloroflexota bacterium]